MGVRGADGRSRLVNVTDTGRDKRTKAQRHWKIAQEQLSILLDIPRVLALHDLIHESFDLLSPNDKTTDAAKSSCFWQVTRKAGTLVADKHGVDKNNKQVRSSISESVKVFLCSEEILKVLKLSAQGLPQSWISLEEAVIHYACRDVRWESGAQVAVFHGGHNAITGEQSIITVNSIIGTRGVPKINPFQMKPGLTNGKLFTRDRNVCAYCGDPFHEQELTREHIIPFAQNGIDNWMNVVTACRACNHRKSSRTPEQANMPLLYAPYVPSLWEDFILRNRRIMADQMEFLMAHVPKTSRLSA